MNPARILPPSPVQVVVALEPVYNILVSMNALEQKPYLSGLSEWVMHTVPLIPPEIMQRHHQLFHGIGLDSLVNAVPRGPATSDFAHYLAALAQQEPVALRDRLLYWLLNSPMWRTLYDAVLLTPPTVAEVLADPACALRFFEERAREKLNEDEVYALFALINQPDTLQQLLVEHLQWLWENHVAAEWQRIQPLLQESAELFAGLNLSGLTILEAIETVTGRDLRSIFRLEELLRYEQIRFIPTVHNGPYLIWFGNEQELCMTYVARRPQRSAERYAPLDQTELANRFAALADETRLQMLFMMREQGELSTQELIDRFGLNKSAASRHLRQLFATNLIRERREDGAKKIYWINTAVVEETVRWLQALL